MRFFRAYRERVIHNKLAVLVAFAIQFIEAVGMVESVFFYSLVSPYWGNVE
ncbi:MAG: hypothetical protein KAH22_08365 [Thiotrichaceae bacterium]|nr:hypothetical protein [Thiotrichaceae bacterium]